MRIFVGISSSFTGRIVASRTKIGLSEFLGVSVKTVERSLKGLVGEDCGWVRVGKSGSGKEDVWGVREIEVIETRNGGNVGNWSGGFRGMKGKDGLLRDAEN